MAGFSKLVAADFGTDYVIGHGSAFYAVGHVGPFVYGGALYAIGRSYFAPYFEVAVLKSTDGGLTWSVLDVANLPRGAGGFLDVDAAHCTTDHGQSIFVAYAYREGTGDYFLRVSEFSLATETWFAGVVDGPALSVYNNMGRRIFIAPWGADRDGRIVRIVAMYAPLYAGAGDQIQVAVRLYGVNLRTWGDTVVLTPTTPFFAPLGFVVGTNHLHCFIARNATFAAGTPDPELLHVALTIAALPGDLQLVSADVRAARQFGGYDYAQMGRGCRHGTKVAVPFPGADYTHLVIASADSELNPVWSCETITLESCPGSNCPRLGIAPNGSDRFLPAALFSEVAGLRLLAYGELAPNNNRIFTALKNGGAWSVPEVLLNAGTDAAMPGGTPRVLTWPSFARMADGAYSMLCVSHQLNPDFTYNYSTYELVYGEVTPGAPGGAGRSVGLVPGAFLIAPGGVF